MTSEQNVSEVQPHQGSTVSPAQQDGDAQYSGGANVPHGMGQSKSSRRRRRKRKNKGADMAPQGEQAAGQPIGSIQASAQPQTFQPGPATELPGRWPAAEQQQRRQTLEEEVPRPRSPARRRTRMLAARAAASATAIRTSPATRQAGSSARAAAASSSADLAASSAPWTTAIAR